MLLVCGQERDLDWSTVEKAPITILRSASGSVKLPSPFQAQVIERYPHYLFVEDEDEAVKRVNKQDQIQNCWQVSAYVSRRLPLSASP